MKHTSETVSDFGAGQHHFVVRHLFVQFQHFGVVRDVSTESDGCQRDCNTHARVVMLPYNR